MDVYLCFSFFIFCFLFLLDFLCIFSSTTKSLNLSWSKLPGSDSRFTSSDLRRCSDQWTLGCTVEISPFTECEGRRKLWGFWGLCEMRLRIPCARLRWSNWWCPAAAECRLFLRRNLIGFRTALDIHLHSSNSRRVGSQWKTTSCGDRRKFLRLLYLL